MMLILNRADVRRALAMPEAIAAALDRAAEHPWDPEALRQRAEDFGERRFIDTIRGIVEAERRAG